MRVRRTIECSFPCDQREQDDENDDTELQNHAPAHQLVGPPRVAAAEKLRDAHEQHGQDRQQTKDDDKREKGFHSRHYRPAATGLGMRASSSDLLSALGDSSAKEL